MKPIETFTTNVGALLTTITPQQIYGVMELIYYIVGAKLELEDI